jgi:hypothetical protein
VQGEHEPLGLRVQPAALPVETLERGGGKRKVQGEAVRPMNGPPPPRWADDSRVAAFCERHLDERNVHGSSSWHQPWASAQPEAGDRQATPVCYLRAPTRRNPERCVRLLQPLPGLLPGHPHEREGLETDTTTRCQQSWQFSAGAKNLGQTVPTSVASPMECPSHTVYLVPTIVARLTVGVPGHDSWHQGVPVNLTVRRSPRALAFSLS